MSLADGHGAAERVQTISKERIVARDEGPLVFFDVVHFARHVVVAADHVDLALKEERFVAHTKLVHRLKLLPGLCNCVEEVHFTVSVCVFSAYQNDF